MFDRLRVQVLRLLRVPPDPTAPLGAPGSLRVFRAGRNLYKLGLLRWGIGQAGALAGILVSIWFVEELARGAAAARAQIESVRQMEARRVEPATAPATPTPAATPGPQRRPLRQLSRSLEHFPWWFFSLLKLFEFAGIVVYLVQIPLTYALVRLDYELRWYLVTDRSLRIRSGITTVQESTMSFANVQQVVVSQGPLQRLLGLADLRVTSAGGGGGETHHQGTGAALHTGVFHGVENASLIRDLILERLRQFRESGLGDPDEAVHQLPTTPCGPPAAAATLTAAREVLSAARALRRVLG